MPILSQPVPAPSHPFADLDRLGDEIADLSAHLDAASARLLTLIREFDARGGWNHGFRSCAHSTTAIAAVGSRAVVCHSAKAITFAIGPTAAPPRSPTSRCCAGVITAPFMKRVTGWNDTPTAR